MSYSSFRRLQYTPRYRPAKRLVKKMTHYLCRCPEPRTRELTIPQQCRRCGTRIDRSYDGEIVRVVTA